MPKNNSPCHLVALVILAILSGGVELQSAPKGGPYQATGVKVGEVTHDSVIIWTRATKDDKPGIPLDELDAWQNSIDLSNLANLFEPSDLGGLEIEPVLGGDAQIDEKLTREQKRAIVRAGAVPGANADIQISYHPENRPESTLTSQRLSTRSNRDYTRPFHLTGLTPDTTYRCVSSIYPRNSTESSSTLEFSFKTAPAPNQARRVGFTVVTGQAYRNVDAFELDPSLLAIEGAAEIAEDEVILGHEIYKTMLTFKPDFLINTGDVVYYDHQGASAKSKRMARVWWQRMFSLPYMRGFNRKVPTYFMKDDHDTLKNDCWPGQRHGRLSYNQGRRIFHEQTPFPIRTDDLSTEDDNMSINNGEPYRTVRWGKDLQVWMLETRDFRSPNTMDYNNPAKTMLGVEQTAWLDRTLAESTAGFKIVVFALPFIGPDRPEEVTQEEKDNLGIINLFRPPRIDNLANEAWHLERTRLLELLSKHEGVIVICGDRHWKYHSAWPDRFNPKIHEFSCGATSDKHAASLLRMYGVPTPENHDMLYWRDEVEQGGFLSVEVEPGSGGSRPVAIFRFHKVDGSPAYPLNTQGTRDVRIYPDGSAVARPKNL